MQITQRQIGRIESALAGLEEQTVPAGKRLLNIIREQLDEMEVCDAPEMDFPELTSKAEGEDGTEEDGIVPPVSEMREYGKALLDGECGIVPAIRELLDVFGLTKKELADELGVSRTAVSLAVHGRGVRPILKARMAEYFGEGRE